MRNRAVAFFALAGICVVAAVAFAVDAVPSRRASMRCQTRAGGAIGGTAAVSGIRRSCHARTASRKAGWAGSSASKRRRAGPRSVPAA